MLFGASKCEPHYQIRIAQSTYHDWRVFQCLPGDDVQEVAPHWKIKENKSKFIKELKAAPLSRPSVVPSPRDFVDTRRGSCIVFGRVDQVMAAVSSQYISAIQSWDVFVKYTCARARTQKGQKLPVFGKKYGKYGSKTTI